MANIYIHLPLGHPIMSFETIGHFQKYNNILCLSSKILHKNCFYFLLGLTIVSRENKNNAHAKFWRTNEEYYGIFESGLWKSKWLPYLQNGLLTNSIVTST